MNIFDRNCILINNSAGYLGAKGRATTGKIRKMPILGTKNTDFCQPG
jgi:hypothetical protein